MKNIFTFLFLLISFGVFAQNNEIILSHQPFESEENSKGLSLSYYRNLSDQFAFGLKTGFHGLNKPKSYERVTYTANIDVVARRNFSKNKKVRFMGEFGVSALRKIHNPYQWVAFCGFGIPGESPSSHYNGSWKGINYFGVSSALILDVKLFKRFTLGSSYGLNLYLRNNDPKANVTKLSNLSLNLGVKF